MHHPFIILAHVPTDAVQFGFLPAAKRLDLYTIILTDQATEHREIYSDGKTVSVPDEIISCDVFNPLSVLETLTSLPFHPCGIFSNSDHLQTSTSIVAQYFHLPTKDWRVTYTCKNKSVMRERLEEKGIDKLWYHSLRSKEDLNNLPEQIPFPLILKPREGVASQNVVQVETREHLKKSATQIWEQYPGTPLLLEEFIVGPLFSVETLGTHEHIVAIGGFEVKLTPPPYFTEIEAHWQNKVPDHALEVVEQIKALGVGFGSCHTEYALTQTGPRIIEINYRAAGDGAERLIHEIVGFPFLDTIINLYLGQPLPKINPNNQVVSSIYLPLKQTGTLKKNPAEFIKTVRGFTFKFETMFPENTRIVKSNSNKDYLGVLHGFGSDQQRLKILLDELKESLRWEVDYEPEN